MGRHREREKGKEREQALGPQGRNLKLLPDPHCGGVNWPPELADFFSLLSFSGGKVLSLMHQHCGPPVTDPFKFDSVPCISYISLSKERIE